MSALAEISAVNRLRLESDGHGVNTLVALYGCPLRCAYCINQKLHQSSRYSLSVEELYHKVRIDDLYFRYTAGGICFGGHEPLLQSGFIREFAEFLQTNHVDWKLTLETSLNVKEDLLLACMEYLDYFIIDVKTLDQTIYKQYTGSDNQLVLKNLGILLKNKPLDAVRVRLPVIPEFNTMADIENSKLILKTDYSLEDRNIEIFQYLVR